MNEHTARPPAAPARLRPVDLARLAGISTQQIRNYEDAGVLPPAPRTMSGYRTFEDVHRRALLAYRALAKGYGPVAATEIMRTVHVGDVPGALALVDAAHAALHEERVSLRAASEALEALAREARAEKARVEKARIEKAGSGSSGAGSSGAGSSGAEKPRRSPRPGPDLRIGEVADLLGVRTSALRVWESAGLLTPRRERGTAYRHYSPADVRDARLVHTLRRSHYPLHQIRPVLEDLHRTGGSEALHESIAARRAALTERTTAMLAGAGQLHAYLTHGHQPKS
ncbi:TioE family transcriptional regulator [Streptomyces acidicola]|uniref:MerR family transcriptional regulator n=1 Tax=Streptomyces acidicola TaxID=2596892 RepID=A0A5N8X148_9ACTN|nr:TioE family transcriptional regulator [Streptomyces acidicola]MPY53269.1 MerR family transcriptional regulator [Streptomyces acidicola]